MIKLTRQSDKKPIYINHKSIDMVGTDFNTGVTFVCLSGHFADVTETVDEVLEAIQTKRLAETLRHEFAGLR